MLLSAKWSGGKGRGKETRWETVNSRPGKRWWLLKLGRRDKNGYSEQEEGITGQF